jgi:hypothetical protein
MTSRENADRLAYLKSLRIKIQGALDGSIGKSETASYTINDSDGTQSLTRRSPKELWEMLREVSDEIAALERQINGGGVRTFGTRLRP